MSDHASATGRPIDQWPDALEASIAHCASWRSVTVLRETASTQDHARNLEVGSVVVAGRQTAGRGRLGRSWIDTAEDGLALSANIAAHSPQWISLAAAIASAQAIEDLCRRETGGAPIVRLKWPNDLLIAQKKVGGILVERNDRSATIGIGINCTQRAFPAELSSRATSLFLQGFAIDRLDLARALLERLDFWIAANEEAIAEEFAARDCLVGNRASFRTPNGIVDGEVLRVDPSQGIVVRTSRGDQHLPAATTSVFVPEDRL
ncbi:MAG: biotin--[acetyl-CoA-carboxylase] ligase [Planctomycetota bacterium]|nr:biotin--[acetyl-CoA-carboxylase] ligase [Planctomycetota bacterium]